MSQVLRLKDWVRLANGAVTTCADLLDSGRAVLRKCDNWHTRSHGTRTIYMVELPDGGFFEIGKMAYESRTQD